MPSFIVYVCLISIKYFSSTSHFIILSFGDNIFTLVGVLHFLIDKKVTYINTVKYINNAFYVLTNNVTLCYILRKIYCHHCLI